MVEQLLVQMSGVPGAGKSTVAHEIRRRYGAVVLDHDITKSALLDSGVPYDSAGRVSYATMWALARFVLDQGFSVILDSPCYYQQILDNGLQMAKETGACYCYVECVTEDLTELSRRLQARTPLRSQRADLDVAPADFLGEEAVSGENLFREWISGMKRPSHSYVRVNTSLPTAECLAEVFAFLDQCKRRTTHSQSGPAGQ